jgi:hypothetical protein
MRIDTSPLGIHNPSISDDVAGPLPGRFGWNLELLRLVWDGVQLALFQVDDDNMIVSVWTEPVRSCHIYPKGLWGGVFRRGFGKLVLTSLREIYNRSK